ncbi:DUF397 domain-containing protein [Streptomyces sp. WI04-05B]|uniref:DUF397 domain-containing protein n=1 Tax=Streptomyces TaxID=1883 RepID=UPI0029BA923F|nr:MULTISPECIES: DUF397 domain-containing protein [unclassified Streptomyces]MDX2542768.1 DUF397 domain-containing protein [Streptomyces sp. WI04-05B]MDX2588312.1 DUF397 domain-containing protein [Streptomyces sp. WI04-05A]MDX3747411.1 DUF397 domain-containing protein [Streptomyces sp. AK08-02]
MSTHHSALELADDDSWFKSSYSDETGGTCVEVAHLTPTRIGVRDSKHPQGPALLFPPEAFAALLDHLRS